MIPYAKALGLVLESVPRQPEKPLPVEEALGLVLTRPLKARFRLPRFDQSAMDGIAVRCADVGGATAEQPAELKLEGELPAGTERRARLRRGHAVKVFTGSPLPSGTEAVVMVEDCRFDADRVEVARAAPPGQHIRRAGEEVRRGDELLPAGVRVTPPVVGLLAHFGIEEVAVRPWPRVGVITMGDELAAPGENLGPTQTYDSNAPALLSALRGMGVHELRHTRVDDRPENLRHALEDHLKSRNVVITVGGASVGDHDHVARIRDELGVRTVFDRVAIKPGKPNLFGLWNDRCAVFSLPGNPVSALVSFHQLLRPALRAMVGLAPDLNPPERARLAREIRRQPGRLEWMRGILTWDRNRWNVFPVFAQGSHMLSGLAAADVLIEVDVRRERIERGEDVRIVPLRWFE